MKSTEFEAAINDLQRLLSNLANSGRLTATEIEQFNKDQKAIIAFYNYLIGNAPIVYPWNDVVFIDWWVKWKIYKKQQFKFTYKSIAEQSALQNLQELSENDMFCAIRIIKKSIDSGWMGFFKEKNKPFTKPKTSTTYKQNLTNRLIGSK
jgi:hypothetical protein